LKTDLIVDLGFINSKEKMPSKINGISFFLRFLTDYGK